MNMYETGEIDVTGVSISYIDKVTDEAGPFYQDLEAVPELSFFYIGFDTTKPPFDDIDIRRAFSQAIDKDKLVSLVFRGMVQQADGILPPGMPGYNQGLSGFDFDIARAKELIRNSEYGDVSRLPPITITTSGWGGLISQGLEAIIQEWRQNLGVEVRVRQLEPERFIYNLKQEKDEMFYTGWIADYPHPQDFLDILFHSEADNNYGEYSSPEVDALLERGYYLPTSELCDGVDNDCDGVVDETDEMPLEICDGVDNDCDGQVDEAEDSCWDGGYCEYLESYYACEFGVCGIFGGYYYCEGD